MAAVYIAAHPPLPPGAVSAADRPSPAEAVAALAVADTRSQAVVTPVAATGATGK